MTRQSLFFCHNQLHEHGIICPVALPYSVLFVSRARFVQVALMWWFWFAFLILCFISAIVVYAAIASDRLEVGDDGQSKPTPCPKVAAQGSSRVNAGMLETL